MRCRPPAAGPRPTVRGRRREPVQHGRDRRVADRVEAALHRRARRSRRRWSRDLLGGDVRRARSAVGRRGRARRRCAVREPERAVGVQVAAGADRAQLPGLRRAHQLAPVPVHLRQPAARTARSSPVKSVLARTCPARRTRAPPRCPATPRARSAARCAAAPLRRRHRAQRDRPHHVVRVARAASPTRRSPAPSPPPARAAQQRRRAPAPSGSTPATGRPAGRPPARSSSAASGGVAVRPRSTRPSRGRAPPRRRAGPPRTPATASSSSPADAGRRTGPARPAPARCRWRARARRRTPASPARRRGRRRGRPAGASASRAEPGDPAVARPAARSRRGSAGRVDAAAAVAGVRGARHGRSVCRAAAPRTAPAPPGSARSRSSANSACPGT